MDFISVLSFLGVAVLLTLMPGPDNLFVLAQSISQGKKAGIATACGLCSGLIIHVAAAALGISAIIYQSAIAFAIVKYAGAAYLLYLAWKSFREKESGLTLNDQKSLNYHSLYKKGILMNILNPKVSLFFLALLPQFVEQSTGHVPIQMLVLGVVFMLQAIIIFIAISFFSEKVRNLLLKSPRISKKLNYIQGTLLGIIGLNIAFSGNK
ncbi:LysE family translocator [Paenibacillus motobuensis]|uniref:LysE family translocator n=1 Tax=Paenibacillus TaxID=44249 RepID=UPI00203C4FEA|nr:MULTISPECIES: LysE family translocator [Paenibacillus]MCM3039450.1 LysE family translocator [Paenibacillus lutimineralis]MCM3646554.1 LysE family translocator [Paenibacillus motobuensis]